MAVTCKLNTSETQQRFRDTSKGCQSGSVNLTLKQCHEIYVFEQAYDEFVKWAGREYYIFCQGRTPAANKAVGGNSSSNHLRLLARDTYFKGVTWTEERIIKYMRKWKEISQKHGFIGECGFYKNYKYNGCTGMMHIGGFITYSKTFTNWMTDSKGQHNQYYKL